MQTSAPVPEDNVSHAAGVPGVREHMAHNCGDSTVPGAVRAVEFHFRSDWKSGFDVIRGHGDGELGV